MHAVASQWQWITSVTLFGILIFFIHFWGFVASTMNCLYCATLRWRFVINSHSRRVHHTVACLEEQQKLHCNVVSVHTFFYLCPAILSLAFSRVLQFHVLLFGPSFSCPAISRPATWSVNFICPANKCPAILTVSHFHVRHFQSTRSNLVAYWLVLLTTSTTYRSGVTENQVFHQMQWICCLDQRQIYCLKPAWHPSYAWSLNTWAAVLSTNTHQKTT